MTKKSTSRLKTLRPTSLAQVNGGGGLMSLLNTSAAPPAPSPDLRTIALAD